MKTLLINYNAFALDFAMQFDEVAADIVLLRLGENVQFSPAIFEINPLFNPIPHGGVRRIYPQIVFFITSVRMQQNLKIW